MVDDSSWSRLIGENLTGLAGDSVACNKCDAIHDGGKFAECQVCGGEGPTCDDCELPLDICACAEAEAYNKANPLEVKVGGEVVGHIVDFKFSNNIPKLAVCRCGSKIAAAFCCGTPVNG